jgi:alkylhydroperoxidase family enzyme
MAYVAFADAETAALTPMLSRTKPSFSPIEWSVVALARGDRLTSLREPGRISMAMGALFGERTNPRLADPRLEALRRMSVLTWHHGYTIPSSELRAFCAAGFDAAQYELLVDSIAADQANARRRKAA